MAHNRWLFILAMGFLAMASQVRGQRASSWRLFNSRDGLPETACQSVSLTPQGNVLVRFIHTPAFASLDGFGTVTSEVPAGISGQIEASPSGQLWAVVTQGLAEFHNGAWKVHPIPEIASALANPSSPSPRPAIPLLPVRQGRVLFLLPDRLMVFTVDGGAQVEELRSAEQTRFGPFTGLCLARDGGLWISGKRGLAKLPGPARTLAASEPWTEFIPPADLGVTELRQPLEEDQGGVVLTADLREHGGCAYVKFDGVSRWTAQSLGRGDILQTWTGPNHAIWAVSSNALWERRVAGADMAENDDLSGRRFNDVAVEPGGTFWLATSDGLFRYAPPLWQSPAWPDVAGVPARCPVDDADGNFWFLSRSSLFCVSPAGTREFALPAPGSRLIQTARALVPLKGGTLLLDAGAGECFLFHAEASRFTPLPADAARTRIQVLGRMPDGTVCVKTTAPGGPDTNGRLELFDGARFLPFPFPQPPVSGTVTAIYPAQNGDFWIGTDQAVCRYHSGLWRTFSSSDGSTPAGAEAFVERTDGKLWCATPDRIWEFDGRAWSVVQAGFDRIDSLLRSRDGGVWVSTSSGMWRESQGHWIENGLEEGLPDEAVREICEDRAGGIWAATGRGLSRYVSGADPDPPKTSVRRLMDRSDGLLEGDSMNILFHAEDKWRFTPASRLVFSYRLDQQDWSPFQELNAVSLPRLAAGKHYFQVRAQDRNGNIDPTPALLDFDVALPWYEEARLLVICSLAVAAASLFAALALNRHRQLQRSYAAVEKKITERTRELEIANRELLHSQKMNALGTLAAGVAHDFNNILSIIRGSAQIIEGNLENPAKIRTRVDRIKTVVEQGAGIVQAMLGFSRASDLPPAPCDLNTVVTDTIRLLGDRFLREVRVVFEPAAPLPPVTVPRDLVQQILLNFIFNAAESMSSQRQVLLATSLLTHPPEETVLAPGRADAWVAVSVQDSGCGIPQEILSRIFEPFFTTKAMSARRGTGLGLSMAYELARKMDAGIGVHSVVGKGSTFTLVLPVTLSSAAKTQEPTDASEATAAQPR